MGEISRVDALYRGQVFDSTSGYEGLGFEIKNVSWNHMNLFVKQLAVGFASEIICSSQKSKKRRSSWKTYYCRNEYIIYIWPILPNCVRNLHSQDHLYTFSNLVPVLLDYD